MIELPVPLKTVLSRYSVTILGLLTTLYFKLLVQQTSTKVLILSVTHRQHKPAIKRVLALADILRSAVSTIRICSA